MAQVLSEPQVAAYRRDGFVAPVRVLSEEEALAARARLEAIEAAYGPMHYLVKPHLVLTLADELIRLPGLVGAVADLIGPDVMLWDSSFIIKEPGEGKFVSWHQDLTYWGLEGGRDDVVSVWLALSDASEAAGCMRMVPGSHLSGMAEHVDTYSPDNVLSRGQTIRGVDESKAVAVPLRPGQMSLHHGWVFHASHPNVTNDRRIGLNMNLIKPSVRQTRIPRDTATLLAGRDAYGLYDPEPRPVRDFAPEACAAQAAISRLRGLEVSYNPAGRPVNRQVKMAPAAP